MDKPKDHRSDAIVQPEDLRKIADELDSATAALLATLRRSEIVHGLRVKAEERAAPDPSVSRSRVILPPGSGLSSVVRFLLTRDAYRRFVKPVIADMQHEYIEAIAAGETWRARWIVVLGHLHIVPGWLYGLAARAIKRIFTA